MKKISLRNMPKQRLAIIIAFSAVLVISGLAIAGASNKSPSDVASIRAPYGNGRGNSSASSGVSNRNSSIQTVTPLDVTAVSTDATTAEGLLYMIEEEKLAQDAYQVMYDTWGFRIFSNISRSEQSHQNLVLAVMKNRNIADPRSNDVGVFTNPTLQALYDKLIAQGSQSLTEAFNVGVAIEERDIADLKSTILGLNLADTDVKAVYESLLNGSERHLTAFNRQLSR